MTFTPKYNLIEELKWRGLLHDTFPGTEDLLNKEQVSGYVGFDPTADSLHVGNLVPIILLKHLQSAGHKPYALVGGATGLVGDPSGKSSERNLLDKETLLHNQACIKKQLEKFLDFEAKENAAEMLNNYDWFGTIGFLDFIREVGKHISVNYMMAKDSVKNRLENGMSFTEFSYQLIQGYDFAHLFKHKNCKLQMGGSDQWGNITTGTELIRRMHGGEAYALTSPLVTKADGTKFGKSEAGNVWLDPSKTSPYAFYQFWLNVSDVDAEKFIKIFTFLDRNSIESLIEEHQKEPHLRKLQKVLAKELCCLVHSEADYDMAIKASDVFFGNSGAEELLALGKLQFVQAVEGMPKSNLSYREEGYPILDLLSTDTGIFASKGEARKMILAGGLSINKAKAIDPNQIIQKENFIFEEYLLVQKGKKNYFLVHFQ